MHFVDVHFILVSHSKRSVLMSGYLEQIRQNKIDASKNQKKNSNIGLVRLVELVCELYSNFKFISKLQNICSKSSQDFLETKNVMFLKINW